MDKFLDLLNSSYPLEFICEEKTKVKSMNFVIKQYHAKGLGNVSTMKMSMPLKIMEMDSLIINPFEIDLPLLSYDRVFALGNDSLYLEIFETRIKDADKPKYIKDLINLKNEYSFMVKPAWYEDILYKESLHMKTKKKNSDRLDKDSDIFFNEYLRWAKDTNKCDVKEKMSKARLYTEGLLENGGPSTDMFLKNKGKEYTEKLFRNILFGTL